jgi:hypothetical protein
MFTTRGFVHFSNIDIYINKDSSKVVKTNNLIPLMHFIKHLSYIYINSMKIKIWLIHIVYLVCFHLKTCRGLIESKDLASRIPNSSDELGEQLDVA